MSFVLLLGFSTSLVFSSVHHVLEEHHHKEEECSAVEKGETHLHVWEFEDCNLCDLENNNSYSGLILPNFSTDIDEIIIYQENYIEFFTKTQILTFSNRGPPAV